MPRLWTLRLSTFATTVPGAQHWYCKLYNQDGHVEVDYIMNEEETAKFNDVEADFGYEYTVGETAGRWFSKEDAIEAGRVAFDLLAEDGDLLVRRDWAVAGPGRPLIGPYELCRKVRGLFILADDLGWWETAESSQKMNKITMAWEVLLEGYGIDPNPPTKKNEPSANEFLVLIRDEGLWRVATREEADAWMKVKCPKDG